MVLIEALDLSIGPGLTALTGETGAGKSIILDALGLATGARADAGLVRRGAAQAAASAVFAPAPDHPVWDLLEEKGLAYARDEDLVLRRTLAADGRSRAFVNDQATGVGVLQASSARRCWRCTASTRPWACSTPAPTARCSTPSAAWTAGAAAVARALARLARGARARSRRCAPTVARAAAETEELTLRLAELDRLDPREGEEAELAEERAMLGAAEKALADIAAAREAVRRPVRPGRPAPSRALERARERALQAGAARGPGRGEAADRGRRGASTAC